MLTIQNLSYTHLNKDLLFEGIHLTVNKHDKIALIGNNGVGKSTLLKLITKELTPSQGHILWDSEPYYIPQIFGQFNHLTLAQALGIENKLNALREILKGNTTEENFQVLNDDWTLEERCHASLEDWGLSGLDLSQSMETLSGGQKTEVFLAGISIHEPEFILLDEPSNHLDLERRELLYAFIESTKSTILLVSHDRKLLNLVSIVCELNKHGIKVYGGNFDFYKEQKQIENKALSQDIQSKEKALKKAKEKERETIERQQKLDSRGKGKQEKSGVSRIMLNTLRNQAENSSSKLKSVHAEKIGGLSKDLQDLRSGLSYFDKMKFGFSPSQLHTGKILIKAENLNVQYAEKLLWREDLTFQILSGERIALKGQNGSGKTTLLNLLLGELRPETGTLFKADCTAVCIDQDYSLLKSGLTVLEQAQQFNTSAQQEHVVKTQLNRFLFSKEDWNKPCFALSGGERMRLSLCCLTLSEQSPDLILLDEPTNNLDIQNVEILTSALNEYEGNLLVVSHDETFLKQIRVEREIRL